MSPVLRIVGSVAGGEPCPFAGQYVVEYDPERDGLDPHGRRMTAHVITSPRRADALEYPSTIAALEAWRRVSARAPVRPDGKPNRPLTAYTVEVLP